MVLAIGTELGETDYDVVFDGNFQIASTSALIRIDIDAEQLQPELSGRRCGAGRCGALRVRRAALRRWVRHVQRSTAAAM